MEQIEITFRLDGIGETNLDILPYRLGNIGFEGFINNESCLLAYVSPDNYNHGALLELLGSMGIPADCFTESRLPDKNWNEVWESNFEPVVIGGTCYIRAPFHKPASFPVEIVIEPKMSFGTGHHATTSLMMSELLRTKVQNLEILDAGCGTGILAILAEKLGAAKVTAVDNDEWSYRNAIENTTLNNCQKINIILGDVADVKGFHYDGILANINLNVLLSGMQNYASLCKTGGFLLMSGILSTDVETLKDEAEKCGFSFESGISLNNWAIVRFKKK